MRSQDYLGDVLTEELTTSLSRLPGSFVVSRTTAFAYRGKAMDVKQIGKELGVRYVLQGSAQKSGTRVRVDAQLIDAVTGALIFGRISSTPMKPISSRCRTRSSFTSPEQYKSN